MEAKGRLSATRIVRCSLNFQLAESFTGQEDFWTTCESPRVERKSHSWNTRCMTTMKDGLHLSMQPAIPARDYRHQPWGRQGTAKAGMVQYLGYGGHCARW